MIISSSWLQSGAEPRVRSPIFDSLFYNNKPNLGLASTVSFIYEWEATIQYDTGNPKNAKSIEAVPFQNAVSARRGGAYEYVVIDIESLPFSDDPIAIQYVELAKAAAPELKIAWWNTGPTYWGHSGVTDHATWLSNWRLRYPLEEINDFFIFGSYFNAGSTITEWTNREMPRVVEARKAFPGKEILVTISPNRFASGDPWPHLSASDFGGMLDRLLDEDVKIVLWSYEGTGNLQTWSEAWPWVSALRARI